MKAGGRRTSPDAGNAGNDEPNVAAAVAVFEPFEAVDTDRAIALYDAGFKSIEDLDKAEISDLVKVKGIGEATATKIKEQLAA